MQIDLLFHVLFVVLPLKVTRTKAGNPDDLYRDI